MRGLFFRICLTMLNILLPPLAVLLLCGAGWDFALNCIFFLLAIIPAHIHGFYISIVYFHRRHKVKKGRWPGPPKSLIRSYNVINGGISNREADRLWQDEQGRKGKTI